MKSEKPTGGGALTWYNGVAPHERRATIPAQRAAVRAGKLVKAKQCSICGCGPAHSRRPCQLVFHDELYTDVTQAFTVCRRCHAVLHLRLEHPERWVRLLKRVSQPNCWAWKLSLDPACQWRPFEETYPEGLPRPE